MSLQWTFIATFLYVEIGVLVLFLLPFIKPQRWQKIFRSRLLNSVRSYANIYFNIFIILLLVLFVDSMRDVRKYMTQEEDKDMSTHPQAEAVIHMKLFRAQRNFYIAGFALFLFVVLRRVVTLISQTASLMADQEASKKQAESATAAAKKLLEDQDNKTNEKEEGDKSEELKKTKQELSKTKDDLDRVCRDLDTMKKQAQSTNTEYDRLMKEHAALQDKLKAPGETKKTS